MNLPGDLSYESYWLLSRKPQISDDSRKSADEVIDKFVDRSKVRVTIQDIEKCGWKIINKNPVL
jgi:lipocalin